MAAKKKKVDPAKAKAQKQKIFVIAGSVLLVLVFAYEAKTLGLLGGKKAPAAAPAVTAPAGTPTGPNSLTPPVIPDAGTAAPVSAPSGDLVDTDAPVSSSEGQLVSFGVFQTKNPFTPQVHNDPAGGSTAEPAPASGATPVDASGATPADSTHADVPAPGATVTPSTEPAGGATPASGTTTTTTTTPSAPRETVTISVNGRSEQVAKDGTFPSGAPVFRLASWSSSTAQVGIVGGSYQTGGQTLTLERGKPVTLMNTSDGKKYKLVLVSTP